MAYWRHSARLCLPQQSSHCRTGRGWSAFITTLLFPIKYLPAALRNDLWKFESAKQCKQRGPQKVDPSFPCPWILARPVSNDKSPEPLWTGSNRTCYFRPFHEEFAVKWHFQLWIHHLLSRPRAQPPKFYRSKLVFAFCQPCWKCWRGRPKDSPQVRQEATYSRISQTDGNRWSNL